jgi:hypothetical protein
MDYKREQNKFRDTFIPMELVLKIFGYIKPYL